MYAERLSMEREFQGETGLLFGLLALQNGLITQGQLVTAFVDWTHDKEQPLDAVLVKQGAIDQACRSLFKQLVELHIARHEGDTTRSINSLQGSNVDLALTELHTRAGTDLENTVEFLDRKPWLEAPAPKNSSSLYDTRFRIIRPLEGGQGGMGIVSVAHDTELDRIVALKQIRKDKRVSPAYQEKFEFEAEVTGKLEHPGIIPIYSLGTDEDLKPYYAMRLVRGEDLGKKIEEFHANRNGSKADFYSLEFIELLDRLIDVCDAVAYAHSRGVLHRDLKPGNIVLGRYGETFVIDWGLAKIADKKEEPLEFDSIGPVKLRGQNDISATIDGSAMGTAGFAPPEQLSGRIHEIDERSDVYALGAILYAILTNQPTVPLRDAHGKKRSMEEVRDLILEGRILPAGEINDDIPIALSAICAKTLSLKREDRYATPLEVKADLERWKNDDPVTVLSDPITNRVVRYFRKHRVAVLAYALTAASGMLLLAITFVGISAKFRWDAVSAIHDAQEAIAAEMMALEEVRNAEDRARREMHRREAEANRARMQMQEQISQTRKLESDLIERKGRLEQLEKTSLELSILEKRIYRQLTLGAAPADALGDLIKLADAYSANGQWYSAILLLERALPIAEEMYGENHPESNAINSRLAIARAKMEAASSVE